MSYLSTAVQKLALYVYCIVDCGLTVYPSWISCSFCNRAASQSIAVVQPMCTYAQGESDLCCELLHLLQREIDGATVIVLEMP